MLLLSFAVACDKVPLLAPTGSVITLFPAASVVPVNGEVEIVATVIENGATTAPTTPTTPGQTPTTPTTPSSTAGAGTPVQNGTVVSFTATLGRIEPAEARTQNGQVRVKFIAGGQSGQAVITAFSGGASASLSGANALRIGSAAAERVVLSATPQTLGPNGGTSTITARVEDVSGLGLRGIPVTFTTDKGVLSSPSVLTENDGTATTRLTTSQQSIVTANVAGKTATVTVGLDPRTGLTLAGPTTPVTALVPVSFTVSVAATANIRDVTLDFGDDTAPQSLGALTGSTTIQHTFRDPLTYTVRATATDANGFRETVSTSVTVLPAQPPSVIVTPSSTTPSLGQSITVRAQVSGNTSSITKYEWNFDAGATPRTITTTSNQVPVRWDTVGTKIITVIVTQASGPTGDGFAAVNVVGTGTGGAITVK